MKAGRRLAFDFGTVRIGVAASDFHGILASPLTTLNASDEHLSQKILEIISEVEPIYLVVGDPKHLSGRSSEKSEAALEFIDLLKTLTDLPIYSIDERLTTVTALKDLQGSGHNAKSSREKVDAVAAVAILDSALQQEKLSGDIQGLQR
jgi:putative Holliday junction resolvase